jgi:hypothetical protein
MAAQALAEYSAFVSIRLDNTLHFRILFSIWQINALFRQYLLAGTIPR